MKRAIFRLLFLLAPVPLPAAELSLYYLNNLAVQYEGTGYRPTQASWELKVKPKAGGQGLRWRRGAFQLQYWRNNPYFTDEAGNGGQTGQARLAVNTLLADIRLPLAGTAVEAVAGVLGFHAALDRKFVALYGVPDPAQPRERLKALGPAIGVHGRAEKTIGSGALWADGEIMVGHFLWTRNRLKADPSPLQREGFSYLFRAEGGIRRGSWRVGLGVVRQMHEVLVPGGQGLPNGAVVSLPINQIDFESPFISVGYDF